MQYDKVFVRADDSELKILFDIHDKRKQALLRGILLSRLRGKDGIDTFNFIHKTILEFFACKSGLNDINNIVAGALSTKKNIT